MPESTLGLIYRSHILHELKRTEEARDNLLRMVDRFPENPIMQHNLACYECQLREPALEVVELGADMLAQAKEAASIGAADGQEHLLAVPDRLAGQHHDLAPVEGFRRSLRHVQRFARLGHIHQGFEHEDRSSDLVANADQPGGVSKIVLGPLVLEAVRDEVDQAGGRLGQERGRNASAGTSRISPSSLALTIGSEPRTRS